MGGHCRSPLVVAAAAATAGEHPASHCIPALQLALWWALWENCSASVRSGDVLSALLFLLTGSNTTVGLVQVGATCWLLWLVDV